MLVNRTFKINDTWIGFHNNIKELTNILGKNQFPSSLMGRTVEQYLCKFFASALHASVALPALMKVTHTMANYVLLARFLTCTLYAELSA